ncbi:MAG: VOC family protein [Proteobacteria bacterium]|nr:VOC family protein [Pseudomonadota bacterium]
MSVKEIAYIGVEASDLNEWARFATDLLGLQIGTRSDDLLTLRMDQKLHRWILTRGPADDLAFMGYECGSDAALDDTVKALKAAGSAVTEGDAALARQRGVQRIAFTTDPLGNRVELVVGLADAATPFQSAKLVGSFVTGSGGAGHHVLMEHGKDRKTVMAWYERLGFKPSDHIDQPMAPGFVASVSFLHCNGRHHSLALANMPFPKRMHHFMMEVSDLSDVGFAYDRCMDDRRPFEMTLGMHPNDRMFSFYVRTPSGFSIEFGWGGLIIDDATWTVKQLDRLSVWGHRPGHVVAELLKAAA